MKAPQVDLSTSIGTVVLKNPVLTAAGTSGHGAELGAYVDLSRLGGVVVKSFAAEEWPGNPPPRLAPIADGMLNSVGLQGAGVQAFIDEELPALLSAGATIVASIWGRRIADYATVAERLSTLPADVVAVEVNVSCPNLDDGERPFSYSPEATAAVVAAAATAGRPRWVKLSPAADDLPSVAKAALAAGAEALTLVNTMPAELIGATPRRGSLGFGAGGVSGPLLRPVALRCVAEVAGACPGAPIVAAGGVFSAADVVEFLAAGARAVEVGTATFLDPRASGRILDDLVAWCEEEGISSIAALFGSRHV